jgi:lambda family phage portal protein
MAGRKNWREKRAAGINRAAPETNPAAAGVNPAALGINRAASMRRALQSSRAVVRMFDAGETDRLTASWGTTPLTADDVVRRNQRVLVARSREQAANNDHGKAFLRMVRQNVVGPRGVQLQAQAQDIGGALDSVANEAIEAAWAKWCRPQTADVTGQLSWRSLQGLLTITAARDGEFMVRVITGAQAGPWGFSLQVIDPQRCPVDFDEGRRRDGSFVRHGIEFNEFGRPLAYYFSSTGARDAEYLFGGRSFVRVPANEILHGFLPEMIGQKRGIPWMATALWRMRMLDGFEKAALVNARASAAKMGFFEWDKDMAPAEDPNADPADREPYSIDAEAGTYHELPPGLSYKAADPQYPAGELAVFGKAMLRGIASGLGVAYNGLANDLEGVNFSSIRQGALDEREHWKDLQEWLIECLHQRVFDRWLRYSLLSGQIVTEQGAALPARSLEKFARISWQPRRWAWIDPRAEVDAAIKSKNSLLIPPGQIIRDQGRDPESTWKEYGRDIAAMRAAGMPDLFIMTSLGLEPAPASPAENPSQSEQPDPFEGDPDAPQP